MSPNVKGCVLQQITKNRFGDMNACESKIEANFGTHTSHLTAIDPV